MFGVSCKLTQHTELIRPKSACWCAQLFDGDEDGGGDGGATLQGDSPREASATAAAAGPLTLDELLAHVQASASLLLWRVISKTRRHNFLQGIN